MDTELAGNPHRPQKTPFMFDTSFGRRMATIAHSPASYDLPAMSNFLEERVSMLKRFRKEISSSGSTDDPALERKAS